MFAAWSPLLSLLDVELDALVLFEATEAPRR